LIVTVKVQTLVLPWLSVAVFVMTVTPTGKVLPLAGTLTTVADPQLSVAVTTNVTLLRLHWPASADNARFSGQLICGFSVSLIVTVNVHVLVLPWLSVAVFVTIVTPIGKVLPLGGTLTTLAEPQLSLAVTENVTLLRVHWPASADNARFGGQEITGF
jgi:hypothetical protein